MSTLPSIEELESLTLRALVAYAASCARRASVPLRSILGDEIVDAPLVIAERFATVPKLDIADAVLGAQAAARMAAAMAKLDKPSLKTAAICGNDAVFAAFAAHNAAKEGDQTEWGRGQATRAVKFAANAAERAARSLGGSASQAAVDASRSDFEELSKMGDRRVQGLVGDPVIWPARGRSA